MNEINSYIGLIGTIATIFIGIITVVLSVYQYKVSKRNENVNNLRSFISRRGEIATSKKYMLELELDTVTYFKGFNIEEIDTILDKDMGLITLSNLRFLKKANLVIVKDRRIIIPSKDYITKKYFLNINNMAILIGFLGYIVFFIIMIIAEKIGIFSYFLMFFLMLCYELIVIKYFDGMITYNLINDYEDFAECSIDKSEDFFQELSSFYNQPIPND